MSAETLRGIRITINFMTIKIIFLLPALILSFIFPCRTGAAEQSFEGKSLLSISVNSPPIVDGSAADECWALAPALTTHDPIADLDIELRSVYVGGEIFILVKFADKTENREHRTLLWDKNQKVYMTGPRREDVFVIKWSREFTPIDLTLSSDDEYKADIWYWKANRTDHSGFADDKFQLYSINKLPESVQLVSKTGRPHYLARSGDSGEAAYKVLVYEKYVGDKASKFGYQKPSGSRADIRAKGLWKNGFWTIEFQRKLDTGNQDDVQLIPPQRYLFGVSRFEIAGRQPEPDMDEPLFGSGDISEHLWLTFGPDAK